MMGALWEKMVGALKNDGRLNTQHGRCALEPFQCQKMLHQLSGGKN